MDLSQFKPINVPNMRQDEPIFQPMEPQINHGPEIIMNGGLFKNLRAENPIVISSGVSVPSSETKKARKKSTSKSPDVEVLDANGNVINGDDVRDDISDLSNINFEETYKETSGMIRGTINQLDILGAELKSELDSVKRTNARNKCAHITNMSEALSSVLNTKLSAIKELNSTVKNINDLTYRRAKDMRALDAGNDDKYIMDMYNAFISSPVGQNVPLGVNTMDITMRNDINGIDVGLPGAMISTTDGQPLMERTINYTPEQQMMIYEQDPDIQMCVVYDKATNNKWFQVMKVSTKTPMPNAPTKDPMFLEDVTIDEKHGIARNTNLNETYPLVILNGDMFRDF